MVARGKARIIQIVLWLTGIGLLAMIGFYRQPQYPKTWFDEGLALQGAINLVAHGQYAMRSSEGFRVLDQPLIANGPGLILPVSALFKMLGVGLIQARILASIFFVLATILFFLVSSHFSGKIAAVISVFVLLSVPTEGFILYGRQALGNVPAVTYFLVGFLFFFRMVKGRSVLNAVISGLFFGLALVTKGQYWIVIPVLGLTLLADLSFYRQVGWRNWVVIILTTSSCMFLWQYVQFLMIGPGNYGEHLAAISSSAKVTVFAFRLQRIPGNIWYLIRSGFPFFILPGLVVSAFESRQRNRQGLERFFAIAFILFWTAWYLFVSVGWSRYAFEVYVVGSLFAGDSILRLVGVVRNTRGIQLHEYKADRILKAAAVGFLCVVILWSTWGFANQVRQVVSYSDSSVQDIGKYLLENIPPDAIVESWEWEIDVLAPGLIFHHPTNDWVDKQTAALQFGDSLDESYDPLLFHPEFLIDGPFSKWTGVYSEIIADGCCELIAIFGDYSLYEIRTDQ